MKYEILYYSHCGQDYSHEYIIADSKEEAEELFFQYWTAWYGGKPRYYIEHIREYDEPTFLTKESVADYIENKNK